MSETKRVSLCPACGDCPEVVLDQAKEAVLIGEDQNFVHLNKEAWNTLVDKVLAGELKQF